MSRHLGTHVWPEVPPDTLLVVPLGAVEQHGPHLPLDTDVRIAVALAERLVAQSPGALLAPALAYGASGEHGCFPGTLSIGTEVTRSVLVELARSARSTFRRTVFVSGHGGNAAPLAAAVRQLRAEGHDVVGWLPMVAGGDAHGGRVETSLMLHIAPHLVRRDALEAGNRRPLSELLPAIRRRGVRAVSPSGVLGDPTTATTDAGRTLMDGLLAGLTRAAHRPRVVP